MTYKFDFVKRSKLFFLLSGIVVVLSMVSLFIQGLNLGIDFQSGSRLDIAVGKKLDVEKEKKILTDLGYKHPNVRVGGAEQDLLIFRTDQVLSKEQVQKIKGKFSQIHKKEIGIQEQVVDPIIGRELAKNAIISVLVASLAIIIYVTIRFEYRFAIAAVISLLYDVIFTVGMFSVLRLEVDVVFIAAILTIVGYSVNDTIVIFDRIREQVERIQPKKWEDLVRVVNEGLHHTLVRSINTVLTVVFASVMLYLFGGESISNFSLALLFGLISGAYSSIFVASQIWIYWKWHSMKKGKEKLAS
ncbi:protein-export membrane protein SecF [Seinonella peptonophila]|uniref:Protein-export membrane protein SecF n=1 Tax=Seinonella peptonophila TaxID=112248 RepID=A0A1M4TR19_9BACL|nr:protein translocase subunit SecF [Seinonella peptonophila]SHE46846.1 protein-export membrane protein SecF [Seinonella peptonophila]